MAKHRIRTLNKLIFASAMSLIALAGAASGTPDSTLYSFRGGRDGEQPYGRLTSDSAGNLYGTTYAGGKTKACRGCGTVFKLTPQGKEKILYVFQGGSDGAAPIAGLTFGNADNIYGTTAFGGASGFGTIFKLAPDGAETVSYSFKGGSDGIGPDSALIADSDGTLYGTTGEGGGSPNCTDGQGGCGTVFQLSPDGTETVLHAFQGGGDGWSPRGELVRDGDGNLYGTTPFGGGSMECGDFGCGTVFKIAPDGTETVLYRFGTDGFWPFGSVILDKAGNLYGTTSGGGDADAGTVFRLASDGTMTILYSFLTGHDGVPLAGLIMDKKGNLYGTASQGGGTEGCHDFGCGIVFKLTPDGKKSTLLSFDKNNGVMPSAALLLGKHGELYGTTHGGGAHKKGVVFQVTK